MFFATDESGMRIPAYLADSSKEYRCSVCKNKVRLRAGEINTPHFAHIANQCEDSWHYDMSQWHLDMQSRFREENREVVLSRNGEKHRADVCKDGVVVEFQHSPISAEEFCARNDFYTSLGFRVAWVFDVSEAYRAKQFEPKNPDDYYLLRWKYPLRVLQYGPVPQNKNPSVSICLYFDVLDPTTPEQLILKRVNWCPLEDGTPTFKWIAVDDDRDIELGPDMDMGQFFRNTWENMRRYLATVKPCVRKYSREKGHRRDEYICPITNSFLLDSKCQRCTHCASVEYYTSKTSRSGVAATIYCSHPYKYHSNEEEYMVTEIWKTH